MPSLDRTTDFAPPSLVILQAEQPLDVGLVTFLRPPHREQACRRIQCLLQRFGPLAKRTLQTADEIQPPVDEFRLGILFTIRFGWLLFVPSDFPAGHLSVPPWGDR